MTLGEYLKDARLYAGLSQIGLGKEVGYSTSYINLIENDKRIPSTKVIKKITTLCHKDYDIAYALWKTTIRPIN